MKSTRATVLPSSNCWIDNSLLAAEWNHAYSRELAAGVKLDAKALAGGTLKYWPPVGRVDNVYGDRNLFCSCLPIGDYSDAE